MYNQRPVFRGNFAKIRVAFCEIPRHCYPHMPYIPRPVDAVVLTDNGSKYKEFIVTCTTNINGLM